MNLMECIRITMQLERNGCVKVGKDKCILKPNHLVYVDAKTPPLHPYDKYPLDNPMTWDTFKHIYLLGK